MNKENKFHLISFEKHITKEEKNSLKLELLNQNIIWYPLSYSNKYGIFSTILQLLIGMLISFKVLINHKVHALHARSMIAALMVYPISKLCKVPLVFDIRDFSADEKVDRGRLKKNSYLYKILLKMEYMLYFHSSKIIALTKASKDVLVKSVGVEENKIHIIPTCADESVFYMLHSDENSANRMRLGYSDSDYIFIHVGSVQEWYLFDSELQYFKLCLQRNENAKLLVLNNYDHDFIFRKLKEYNIPLDSVCKVLSVDYSEVNKYLNLADISLYFIVPSYSKKAAAPTKFAEFVRVKLPSITNAGVGDMDFYINNFNVGVLVDPYSINEEIVTNSLLAIDENINPQYEYLFSKYFSINVATKEYQRVYDAI